MDRTLTTPHTRLRSLLWVLCSTLLISGSALIGRTFYQTLSEKRPLDDRYLISAIVQPEERLPADQLAALMGLASDVPLNLYAVDLAEMTERLLRFPRIRMAKIKRSSPDALYVDVTLRQPVARVEDYPGMALDAEGVCFPCQEQIEGPTVRLGHGTAPKTALHLLQITPDIRWVDVSRVDHARYGLREVVVGLEGGTILRLPTRDYEEALAHYEWLREDYAGVIDLRLPNVAYCSP